jgi:hypothetical protein
MRAFITTCSNRLAHLRQTLPALKQATDGEDIIIVATMNDPEAAEWSAGIADRVVRYDTRASRFDKVSCLKQGTAEAAKMGADQVVLIDCDTLVCEKLPNVPESSIAFCPRGDRDLTGLLFAPTNELLLSLHMASGFKGWGAEDFWLRSSCMTLRNDTSPTILPVQDFFPLRHSDRSWGWGCNHVSLFRNYANYVSLGERLFERLGRTERFFGSKEHRLATGQLDYGQSLAEQVCNLYSKVL